MNLIQVILKHSYRFQQNQAIEVRMLIMTREVKM